MRVALPNDRVRVRLVGAFTGARLDNEQSPDLALGRLGDHVRGVDRFDLDALIAPVRDLIGLRSVVVGECHGRHDQCDEQCEDEDGSASHDDSLSVAQYPTRSRMAAQRSALIRTRQASMVTYAHPNGGGGRAGVRAGPPSSPKVTAPSSTQLVQRAR